MEKTIKQYLGGRKLNTRRVLEPLYNDFKAFLAKKFGRDSWDNFAKANTNDAYDFFDYIRSRPGIPARYDRSDTLASSATIYTKIRLMRKLYSVLQAEGKVRTNIFHTYKITLPHPEERIKRKTESIPLCVVKELFQSTSETIKERQIRCLMALMLAGGLRLSEALGLTIADIKVSPGETRYLQLRKTKSGKQQEQPIPNWCNTVLTKQISQRSLEGAIGVDKLFITYSRAGKVLRNDLTFRTAARQLKSYFRSHQLPNCSSHSLRKTAAVKAVRDGHDAIKIRDFMRHYSLLASQKYIDEAKTIEENIGKKLSYD